MTYSADQLAKKIGSYTRYGITGTLSVIEGIDSIEPRFSRSLLAMLDAMGPCSMYARGRVVQAIHDGVGDWETARRVLYEAIWDYTESQVELLVNAMGQAPFVRWAINVSYRIESEQPEFSVDVFEEDLEALARHYYPLVFAIDWLGYSKSDAVTGFVAWAGQQDDMEEVIALAWEQRHIDPVKLQEIADMKKESHGSLREGVI